MKPRNRRDRAEQEIDLDDLPEEIAQKIHRVMALLNEIDETPEERASTQAFIETSVFFQRAIHRLPVDDAQSPSLPHAGEKEP
jgi:hypothetical protein